MKKNDVVSLNTNPEFKWTVESSDGEFITLIGIGGKHHKADYTLVESPTSSDEEVPLNNLQMAMIELRFDELDDRVQALESKQHPSNRNLMIAIIGSLLLHAVLILI
jgi:hypothetical protein